MKCVAVFCGSSPGSNGVYSLKARLLGKALSEKGIRIVYGLLNINGYFTTIISSIEIMVREGFLKEVYRDMLLVSEDIEELLQKMENYRAPEESKWI